MPRGRMPRVPATSAPSKRRTMASPMATRLSSLVELLGPAGWTTAMRWWPVHSRQAASGFSWAMEDSEEISAERLRPGIVHPWVGQNL